MRRMMLRSLLILLALAATATSCTSAPEFEMLERELFEGPPRDAAFLEGHRTMEWARGIILASGGAVMVIPEGTPPGEGLVIPLSGEPLEIETIGTNAWIAVSGVGLVAIDLSDPADPMVVTAFELEDISSCASAGTSLIVSSTKSGLYLFDAAFVPLSEPLSPVARLENITPVTTIASAGLITAAVSGGDVIMVAMNLGAGSFNEVSRFEAPSKIISAEIIRSILHLLSPEGVVYRYDIHDRTLATASSSPAGKEDQPISAAAREAASRSSRRAL